jgi:hypothetical protein
MAFCTELTSDARGTPCCAASEVVEPPCLSADGTSPKLIPSCWAIPESVPPSAGVGGRAVAGIGPAPAGSSAVWIGSIRVTSAERVTDQVTRAGRHQLIGLVEVADEGRLAIVADATGVAFGTWEARRRTGAQVVGVPNSWAMSARHTTDLDRSEKVYGECGVFAVSAPRD